MGTSRATCTECEGRGEKLREKDRYVTNGMAQWFQALIFPRCKKCKGAKTVKQKNKHEIHVEKGMADRQRIVLAGAGDQEVNWILIAEFTFDEFILFSLESPSVM